MFQSFLFLLCVGVAHAKKIRGFRVGSVSDDGDDDERFMQRVLGLVVLLVGALLVCTIIYCFQQMRKPKEGDESKLVTAAATKLWADAPVGVGFVTGKDYAAITRILDDSIFHDTNLRPDMKVVSINNTRINSGDHAVEIISSSKLIVTMLAHSAGYFGNTNDFVTATACKQQPGQTVGVVYQKKVGSNHVQLKYLTETSLLAGSDVSPGMEVVAINNVPVSSVAQAKNLTIEAFPLVTILARRNTKNVDEDHVDEAPMAVAQ